MSASNSAGIQTLLEAERHSQEIVQEARAYRTQRVKASKTDAAKEVEEYKTKKEQEFQSSVAADEKSDEKGETIANEEAASQIEQLKNRSASHLDTVVQFLIEQAASTS